MKSLFDFCHWVNISCINSFAILFIVRLGIEICCISIPLHITALRVETSDGIKSMPVPTRSINLEFEDDLVGGCW